MTTHSPEKLRMLLRYEPETGKFFWKERDASFFKAARNAETFNRDTAGLETALSKDSYGYLQISVLRKMILAHRAAWAIHYGEWPQGSLDHINRIRTDNRISNLRVLPHADNCLNRNIRADNTSGVAGVSYHSRRGLWIAAIVVEGRSKTLGAFKTKEDAVRVRLAAEKEFYAVRINLP